MTKVNQDGQLEWTFGENELADQMYNKLIKEGYTIYKIEKTKFKDAVSYFFEEVDDTKQIATITIYNDDSIYFSVNCVGFLYDKEGKIIG